MVPRSLYGWACPCARRPVAAGRRPHGGGRGTARVRVGTVWFRGGRLHPAAGIGGSFVGAWVNHRLDEGLVLGGLAVVMVVASIGMAPGRPARPGPTPGMMTRAGRPGDGPHVAEGDRGRAQPGRDDRPVRCRGRVPRGAGHGAGARPATPVAVGASLIEPVAVNASAGLVAHLGLGPIGVPRRWRSPPAKLLGALGGQCLASQLSSGALGQAFAVFT